MAKWSGMELLTSMRVRQLHPTNLRIRPSDAERGPNINWEERYVAPCPRGREHPGLTMERSGLQGHSPAPERRASRGEHVLLALLHHTVHHLGGG